MSVLQPSETLRDDPYPTRRRAPAGTLPRRDPVVHGTRPEQLDHGQWASYQRDGFLFLPDFLPPPEVRYLMDDARRVAAELSRVAPGEVQRGPGPGRVDRVFRIHEHSPRAACLVENLQLVAIVEAILGGPVYVHQSHLDFHPEPRRRTQGWRADFEVWHAEDGMPRMRALSCLILLDDDVGDAGGGPVDLLQGSHRRFVPCPGGAPSARVARDLIEHHRIARPRGDAGSLLLYDCNLMHLPSGGGRHPQARLQVVFNSVNNRLQAPFAGTPPRPEHLACRRVLSPVLPPPPS